jgi:hypothetical protein
MRQPAAGKQLQVTDDSSFAQAFQRLRAVTSPSRPPPTGTEPQSLPQHSQTHQQAEPLCSVDESSAGLREGLWQGQRGLPPLSRKRSEPLSAAAPRRKTRARDSLWTPAAAAAHGIARLHLVDGDH